MAHIEVITFFPLSRNYKLKQQSVRLALLSLNRPSAFPGTLLYPGYTCLNMVIKSIIITDFFVQQFCVYKETMLQA